MLDINPLFNAGHFKEAVALARHELEATPGQLHASLILGKVLLRRSALADGNWTLVFQEDLSAFAPVSSS